MKNRAYGKKTWVFAGGYIPVESTGKEPEYLSKDIVAILNTSGQEASIKITLYFEDQEPVGEYEIKVLPQRLRRFHVNDLINPQAVPLGVAYGGVITSDVPVVVQLTKQHTGQQALALMGLATFSDDNS